MKPTALPSFTAAIASAMFMREIPHATPGSGSLAPATNSTSPRLESLIQGATLKSTPATLALTYRATASASLNALLAKVIVESTIAFSPPLI